MKIKKRVRSKDIIGILESINLLSKESKFSFARDLVNALGIYKIRISYDPRRIY